MLKLESAEVGKGFAWLTDPHGSLSIEAQEELTGELAHDGEFHKDAETLSRYCAPFAGVRQVEASTGVVRLKWRDIPYCVRKNYDLMSFGWNIVLTVDEGLTAIVSKRSTRLSDGGGWHVSANESCTPDDLRHGGDGADRVDAATAAARALYEELGIPCTAASIREEVRTVALFQVLGGLGVLLHVSGENLGWTTEYVLRSHASAPDAWEGEPRAVGLLSSDLLGLADATGWTSWGLPCLQALARK